MSVPELPGVLAADHVHASAVSIAAVQEPSGAVPWVPGGEVDPWDHIEALMALDVAGLHTQARAGYEWLRRMQRPDGTWASRYRRGLVSQPIAETNHSGYVAVGCLHHWLATGDEDFLREMWPTVGRALRFVLSQQTPSGAIGWAVDEAGAGDPLALLSGCSSLHQALRCGVAIGERLDRPQPTWAAAADWLGHAIRRHPEAFADKRRYSMDWYYPVLGGALRGALGRDRLRARWEEFVVPGWGVRCVADRPWVTGAETCELALALDALGDRDAAMELLSSIQHLREDDGSYWTGLVLTDQVRWPIERSTWTAAAVILAVDGLQAESVRSSIFRDIVPLGDAVGETDCDELTCGTAA